MRVIDLDAPDPPGFGRRTALRVALAVAGALAVGAGVAARRSPTAAGSVGPVGSGGDGLPAGSFAGRVSWSDLALLVAVDATGLALAYACDNHGTAVWFTGESHGALLRLAGPTGGLVGHAHPAGLAVRMTLAGRVCAVGLRRLRSGGLYTAENQTGAWIVLDDGRRVGDVAPGWPVRLDRLTPKWARFPSSTRRFRTDWGPLWT